MGLFSLKQSNNSVLAQCFLRTIDEPNVTKIYLFKRAWSIALFYDNDTEKGDDHVLLWTKESGMTTEGSVFAGSGGEAYQYNAANA